MLLISCVSRRLSLLMMRWYWRAFSSLGTRPSSSVSANRRMRASGVFSSWLTFATKSLFMPRQPQLAAHVREHQGEPGEQHQVDEPDQGRLRQGQPPHLLLDRAVAVAQLQLHALERGRGDHTPHLEVLAAARGPVLVEHLAGRLADADHPGVLRVHEVVLEEVAHQLLVRVVQEKRKRTTPSSSPAAVVSGTASSSSRVVAAARAVEPAEGVVERPHLGAGPGRRRRPSRAEDHASRRNASNCTSPRPACASAARMRRAGPRAAARDRPPVRPSALCGASRPRGSPRCTRGAGRPAAAGSS